MSRVLTTTAGDLDLQIPKLRAGSLFPSLLERRRRVDKAPFAIVMESYLQGVSTRKVDDLVKALGADSGISKSEVSRICADLDADVAEFRDRSLADTQFPDVFLDAMCCKVRVCENPGTGTGGRVVSRAVVIATRVRADGHREVLGFDIGDSEDCPFGTAFLRSLRARGLGRVQLVISDAHAGLNASIGAVFIGAAWQRCRFHFMRNVLAVVTKGNADMVAAAIRTVFAQPDAQHVAEQFDTIAAMLCRSHPKVEEMTTGAREDLIAFTSFPASHRKKIWSTNPLRTRERRDQAPHRRRRGLPEHERARTPRRRRSPRDPRPTRDSRRMGRDRPPQPLRSLNGRTHHTDAPDPGGGPVHPAHGMINPLTRTVSSNSTTQRDVTGSLAAAATAELVSGLCAVARSRRAALSKTKANTQRAVGRGSHPRRRHAVLLPLVRRS